MCFERADSRSFGQDGLTNRQLYHNVKQNHFYFYSYTSAVKSFFLNLPFPSSAHASPWLSAFWIADVQCAGLGASLERSRSLLPDTHTATIPMNVQFRRYSGWLLDTERRFIPGRDFLSSQSCSKRFWDNPVSVQSLRTCGNVAGSGSWSLTQNNAEISKKNAWSTTRMPPTPICLHRPGLNRRETILWRTEGKMVDLIVCVRTTPWHRVEQRLTTGGPQVVPKESASWVKYT